MTNPQTKTLLVDKNRNIVPQYFDALAGVFKPVAFDDVSHVSVNQTQLLRANNGEILYQFLRPDGLWESYNPATTGGGGGGPLPTGLVRSVNFNLPDANGDVAVPLMFNLIPMFTPDTLPYEFPEGDSVLSFEFDPANNPDWDALLNGDVSAGELIVKTMHYPDADLVIQEIDTNRDGRYFASYSRSNIGNTWRPIVHNVEVKTVNGIGPDALGNVEIDTGGGSGPMVCTTQTIQTNQWVEPAERPNTNIPIDDPHFHPDKSAILVFTNTTKTPSNTYTVGPDVNAASGYSVIFNEPNTSNVFDITTIRTVTTCTGGGGSPGLVGKPEVSYSYYVPASGSSWETEFDIDIVDYDEDTDVLAFYVGAQRIDISNIEIVSYANPTMHVRLLNGLQTSHGYPTEVWQYKFANGGSSPTPTSPTITTHKFYEEITAGTVDVSVHVPGIKEGNFTYFVGLNDGILRGYLYDIEVDEVNELFILKYTTISMSRFTFIIDVFS